MTSHDDSDRIDGILTVLLKLAAGQFDARAEVSGTGDSLDALAGGINMLGEEIQARAAAVEQATEELRRQVTERSRELAAVLGAMSAEAPDPVEIGATLEERYQVVRLLGAGGMGTVHEVVRVTDGRRFALKTLHGRVDRRTMARFAREAQVATELTHPNLVPVVDLGVTPSGLMYLVMELVEGPTLEDERRRFGEASWSLPILAHIATGLEAIHARGIVHRDLKPGNVLLARGTARIADFGIACLRDDMAPVDGAAPTIHAAKSAPMLTQYGLVIGTPMYMAPELISDVHGVSPAADVFSFGVMACEMISGRSFSDPPFMAVALGTMTQRPDKFPGNLPNRLGELLESCLTLTASERPTAKELVQGLTA